MGKPMYDSVTIGHYSDGSPVRVARVDVAALDIQGRRLGYSLTVTQGGHHEGGLSAGTHSVWRCVDLAPFEAEQKERAGRNTGWMSFHRLESQGDWGEHVHQGLLLKGIPDSEQTGDLLALQLKGYRQNPTRNGLGPWPFGVDNDYKPDPIVEFDWEAYKEGRYDAHGRLTSKKRARLVRQRHNRDIRRQVRKLRAVRRKAQNPQRRHRLTQRIRELLRQQVKPKVHIDTRHHDRH